MNITLVRIFFVAFAAMAIAGEVGHQMAGWERGSTVSMVSAVCCLAFGRILFLENILEKKPIHLGSDTLPPIKDVASIRVAGVPLSEINKMRLLKALLLAKRASCCGSVTKKIPFQIVDHWGGTWELAGC